MLLGPVADRRQAGAEGAGDDVGGVANEDGTVPHPRVAGDLLGHLGVVAGGQERLPFAGGHRQPALIATVLGAGLDEAAARELCARVRCPVLVIQGTDDAITGMDCGIALAEATGGDLIPLDPRAAAQLVDSNGHPRRHPRAQRHLREKLARGSGSGSRTDQARACMASFAP